jgi:hypothetical protein
MKFSVLIAVLSEEMEDKAIDIARAAGAGGVTILSGRGIAAEEKKTFFGMTFEGSQSVLVHVLEKHLSLHVLKCLTRELDLENDTRGIVFTFPIEHVGGINLHEVEQFTESLRHEI